MAGGFPGGSEGNLRDAENGSGPVILRQYALADLTGLVGRPLGQKDNGLAEFPVRTLCDDIGCVKMRP